MLRIEGIKHSGVLVETDSAVMIFDYWRGELPSFPESKPLYVFSSHAHGDHFSKKIFDFKEGRSGSTFYILSDDISEADVPDDAEHLMIGPHVTRTVGPLEVKTLRSNDIGVAFIVAVDGVKIYFAGDLNNWWWGEGDEDVRLQKIYHEELDSIRGMEFDAAFVPLDPRLESAFALGVKDFMARCDTKRLIPIHMWGRYAVVDKLRELPEAAPYADRIEFVMNNKHTV